MTQTPDHWARDPHLAPAVGGLHWARGSFDTLPLGPVFSIIELTFKTGIDIRDVSKPAGKLWRAAAEYLTTLPGLEFLFWGPSLENSSNIYLFLQWDSPIAWQKFQASLGVGLVTGLLASPPFNRAIRLRVECDSMRTSYLDAISFPLDARISAQEKQTINDRVKNSFHPVIGTPSAAAWVEWLEPDVPANPRSEIAPVKAAEQSQVLVVLLARNSLQGGGLGVDILPREVLGGAATKVTICPIEEKPRLLSKTASKPLVGQSTKALLELSPCRQYGQDSELFRQKDAVAYGSRSKDQQSLRAFPVPYGSYEPMGHLNQYNTLNETEPSNVSNQKQLLKVVEVVWLQFKVGYISENTTYQDGSVMRQFLDLGDEIQRNIECEGVSWGREEGSPDTLVVFITWKRFKTGMNTLNDFSNSITMELFASKIPYLAIPPQVQRFPSSFVPSSSGLMELTSFYVSPELLIKELFEKAYVNFQNTMSFPMTTAADRFACTSLYGQFGGWEIDGPIFHRESEATLRFTGVVLWNEKVSTASRWRGNLEELEKFCTRQEARAQWYQDFADGMNSYERLGKFVDALRLMIASSGGVESRFAIDVQQIAKK